MRITLRLIVSLVVASAAVVFVSAGYQARRERARLQDELERRAAVLADGVHHITESLLETDRDADLQRLVERLGNRERLAGVAVYAPDGSPVAMTASLPGRFHALPHIDVQAPGPGGAYSGIVSESGHAWHVFARPMDGEGRLDGTLVLFHNADFVKAHAVNVWRENFTRLFLHVSIICLITILILRWNLIRPMARTVDWIRRLRAGDVTASALPAGDLFGPLTSEVTSMARSLMAARAAAEEEARLRYRHESRWTPERLSAHARSVLQGRPLVVVANREPYMHVWESRKVRCLVPASGLVTAVEPILRACGGTWIAHGSGSADHDTVDSNDRLVVPPGEPSYTLRRVWLTKEEEAGYYYGFSNEGLWPLCHIAHTRPLFRAEDWQQYQRVNALFAEAVLEEIEGAESPCVLIQDYHFALLPRMIAERRPDARVALFWHIPWPNPEAFGICPWARELLHGMLGAHVLGFHTQFHCNNFLDTVDRLLESRIDWEHFAINRAGQTTWVKPFPISVAPEGPADPLGTRPPIRDKEALLAELGLTGVKWLVVGVDRIDYTKGLLERFRSIERLLERYPDLRQRMAFVELGAPSRMLIQRYQDLGQELQREADRINRRFQARGWRPIVLLARHHSHEEIAQYYKAANCCLVTSLHDGMNLVAKEYVMARADERGALVLSRFAGASTELQDALLVNPYDIDQVAEALYAALTMPPEEQLVRMSRMRQAVQENNVYRWAADLLTELTRNRSSGDAEGAVLPQSSNS